MSWKSVNDILGCQQIQAQVSELPLQILLRSWSEIMGEAIANHTQPLSIYRGVLRVATSSAAWAQNLAFARRQLLVKVNAVLPEPVRDIHFATAGWQSLPASQITEPTVVPQEHPSYLGNADLSTRDRCSAENAHTAFTDWAEKIHRRSHNLPLCPQCQCPTPPGELHRWQTCSLCAAKQFQQ